MSPEQARGRPVDKRADIWAFGSVLYELLTGNRVFAGNDATETIAAVVRAEPDWRALPADTPPAIQRLLRRCLEKDPSDRLHDIGDARLEITEAMTAPVDRTPAGAIASAPPTRRAHSALLAWSVATIGLLATIALTWALWFRAAPADARVYRSSILLPAGLSSFASTRLAVSPNGRYLAFVAPDATGQVLLWVRELEGLAVRPLAGTDGAAAPFWSPDSRFLAFVASNSLKKTDVAGGPPLTLGEASAVVPGTWNQDDVIVFTPATGSPLVRVSAAGGTPSPVTTVDAHADEATHAFPFFLPDGQHFLYLAQSSGGVPPGVYVGSLNSKERTRVLEGGSNAQYAAGHLIFMRGTTLMAQPFDVTRLALTGDAVPLADQVQISEATSSIRTGAFAVSHTGVLIYQAGSVASQLVWFDRAGTPVDTLGDRANYADIRLSPDGTHVSVSVAEAGAVTRDLWAMDVAQGQRTRFTFDPEDEWESLWAPDGSRLVFNSRRKGHMDLYYKAASGAGRDEVLLEDGVDKYPQSWSPDGRFILYVTVGTTGQDLWVLPLVGDRKPWPFLQTKFSEGTGQFSPDGRWVAYRSDESGRFEVYVAPFPGAGGKWQISTSGGQFPRWRRDGQEIFYTVTGTNKLMAASVNGRGTGFEVGRLRPLFDLRPRVPRWFYDVSPDGQRFLVNTPEGQAESAPITLVVNWTAALKK
jgi:Tol biopolymer transport system component